MRMQHFLGGLLCLAFVLDTSNRCLGLEQAKQSLFRLKRNVAIGNVYTMDYFIELVEKIERHPAVANNNKKIRDVVNYVRKLAYTEAIWNYLLGLAEDLPANVLTASERSDLTNMMKYRINKLTNEERGVVMTHGGETIAVGNVVLGIAAGLKRNRQLLIDLLPPDEGVKVDNLYATTIAGEVAKSALLNKNGNTGALFGPGGYWSPNSACPEKYLLNGGPISSAPNSLIRGALDGFILGSQVEAWAGRGVRLGQLLKMYYGSGVVYDKKFRSCARYVNFKSLTNDDVFTTQVRLYANVYHTLSRMKVVSPTVDNVKRQEIVDLILFASDFFFINYTATLSKETSCYNSTTEEICERPANVVFVLDESGSIGSENYEKAKRFVKKIIEAFEISQLSTRMAIVEFSYYAMESVGLGKYGSKNRLLCAVDKLHHKGGKTFTDKALNKVHEILTKEQDKSGKKEAEAGTVQIVIILTDGKSTDPDRTKKAVLRIKKDIRDLTMIAIGVGSIYVDDEEKAAEELKMIATDPKKHVFDVSSYDALLTLVKELRNRTCNTPSKLWLNFLQDGNQTIVTATVSPGKVRYFTLKSDLFFGARDIYIEVTPIHGTVTVFASRTTETPGNKDHDYQLTPAGVGKSMTLHIGDPCAGYGNSSATCPPVHLAIYGHKSQLTCADLDCSLPNQIKFTIRMGRPHNKGNLVTSSLPLFVLAFVVSLLNI